MAAKKSLMDNMKAFETSPAATFSEHTPHSEPSSSRPPSRKDKRAITGYFSRKAFQQFQILRAEQDRDVQELIEEAVNDLFKKYGKPPIA